MSSSSDGLSGLPSANQTPITSSVDHTDNSSTLDLSIPGSSTDDLPISGSSTDVGVPAANSLTAVSSCAGPTTSSTVHQSSDAVVQNPPETGPTTCTKQAANSVVLASDVGLSTSSDQPVTYPTGAGIPNTKTPSGSLDHTECPCSLSSPSVKDPSNSSCHLIETPLCYSEVHSPSGSSDDLSDALVNSSKKAITGSCPGQWKCKYCKYEIPRAVGSLQFCPNCGKDHLQSASFPICSKCDTESLNENPQFCFNCGNSFKLPSTTISVETTVAPVVPTATVAETISSTIAGVSSEKSTESVCTEGIDCNSSRSVEAKDTKNKAVSMKECTNGKQSSTMETYASKVAKGSVQKEQSETSTSRKRNCDSKYVDDDMPGPLTRQKMPRNLREAACDVSADDDTEINADPKDISLRKEKRKYSDEELESNRNGNEKPLTKSRSPDFNPTPGLCTNKEKGIEIAFKVIVPTELWSFDDKSSLHLRFEHLGLGGWCHNVGNFTQIRETGNRRVMQCSLYIDVHTLQGPIAYKYYVNASELNSAEDGFEDLQGHDVVVNRCLSVPSSILTRGGSFEKCDGVILPKQHIATSLFKRMTQKLADIAGYFTRSKSNECVKVPNLSETKEFALTEHLSKNKAFIVKCELSDIAKVNLRKCVNNTYQIYDQLRNQEVVYGDISHRGRRDTWREIELDKVFVNWLVDILHHLLESEVKSPHDNGRRMCSVLTVLSLLCRIPSRYKFLNHEDIANMFAMLHMKPKQASAEEWTVRELAIIMNFISKSDYEDLAKDLISFINFIIKQKHLQYPQWLFVLPLVHILKGICQPLEKFGNVITNFNPILDYKCVDLPSSSCTSAFFSKKSSGIEAIYKSLKPLTYMDPLLLPIILHVCPVQELSDFFWHLPIKVSTKFTLNMVKKDTRKEKIPVYGQLLTVLIDRVKSDCEVTKKDDIPVYEAKELFSAFLRVLPVGTYQEHHFKKEFNACLSYILYSLESFGMCGNSKQQHQSRVEKETDSIWHTIAEELRQNWFKYLYVPSAWYWTSDNKKQVHNFLFVFDGMAKLDCPNELQKQWLEILKNILHGKMVKIKDVDMLTEFLVILEQMDNPSVIISNVIFDAVIKRFQHQDYEERLKTLYAKTKSEKLVSRILHEKLVANLPANIQSVSMIILLQWDMWPLFISIHRKEVMRNVSDSRKPTLCDHCALICTMAYSTLEPFFESCQSGSITLREINVAAKKKERLLELYSACLPPSSDKDPNIVLRFKDILNDRCEQASVFEKKKAFLCLFYEHLQRCKEPIEGLNQLFTDITKDYDSTSINKLCVLEKDNVRLIPFIYCEEIFPISIFFQILFKKFGNGFVRYFLRSTIRECKVAKENVNLQNFVQDIWTPFFQRCCTFMESIKNRTIKLSEVHQIEEKCVKQEGQIENQLILLFDGLQECHGFQPSRPSWIYDAVHQIKSYLSLCGQAKAANMVLNIRSKLDLSGNFDIVNHVACKVTTAMQDKPLSSIDTGVATVASFLDEIASCDAKWECIEKYSKCLDVVEWIKNEIDLQKFVSVALHTSAGEGDYSSDRLSNLKIVGSGYGPLIYKLDKASDFETFRLLCKGVWKALEQTPNLPTLLDYCDKDLEWYKSVKETQASVEVTSIGQMNNILNCGCYFIGSSSIKICQNIHEVISLSLQERDQRLVKKQYNLEELRDLESKLVLITGSKKDHRKQVDLFLDTLHSLCHIAEILLNHQQIGNVQYSGWMLQVPCTTNREIVNKLQQLAKEMESKLDEWKECITTARKRYYELNYFTTIQLLTLRQSLGVFKDCKNKAVVPAEVLVLLHSIHCKVNNAVVTEAVNIAISNSRDLDAQNASMDSELNEELEASRISESSMLSNSHASEKDVFRTPSLAVPKLSHESLTKQQEATIAYVTVRVGCSKNLVLKSFEILPKDESDYHDYANWCARNAKLDTFSDDETSEADSDASFKNMEIDVEEDISSNCLSGADSDQPRHFQEVSITRKHIPIQEVVDEKHRIVQEVMLAGYSKERSIEAVERTRACKASLAVKYLQDQEENEDGFFTTLGQQQPSRQNSYSSTSEWINSNDITIYSDTEAEQKYLSLEELGNALKCLNSHLKGDSNRVKRPFPTSSMKEGFPNLLVLQPDAVFKSVLQLYMEDADLPLPSLEEVLLCNPSTTAEEIELFWMRAIHDPGHCRIFCLVNAEKLSNMVSDKALQSLSEISQGHKQYRLVIFYSSVRERESHFVSKLQNFRRAFIPQSNIKEYQAYLTKHWLCQDQATATSAAVVDHEQLGVRVVTSTRSGMGKSLYVQRMADKLKSIKSSTSDSVLVTIPLHGPDVSNDILMEFFKDHMQQPTCCIYHIDIASSVLNKVTSILFSLLILQGISDSQGRVWRCHPDQLYIVETTVFDFGLESKDIPEYLTMCLLSMLPSISCLSPCKSFEKMKASQLSPLELVMDNDIFKSSPYQRVFQYLRRYTGGADLDSFHFSQTIEGTLYECLQMFLHYCGVRDPSWTEIRHFVTFLNIQLESCENSVFTDDTFVGDVMAGLKKFVVKFMIQMSRDFSTSSLKGEVAIENVEDSESDNTLSIYEISERKKWEQSPHPYIFFNQDRISITFVGFMVQICGQYGDLVNPNDNKIMTKQFITKKLYDGLKINKVDFQDNCKLWTKASMIEKLATVLGVEFPYDPDPTYVLTVDNVIKILAIQMRFRCGIPVVIMGETGCGKTRLIRYMCDLIRQGQEAANMQILKVHGGTSEKEIVKFLQAAIKTAERNKLIGLDTVVFFDEANTTDALCLIKEIMCDQRIRGKDICADIKFIAACNPYRKHNDKMIERLENAGLGFFVKADESQQKLGKIPLRQLVYRVLDLPHSMRPLVYDFGQLNMDTERDYIGQIVEDHIKEHPSLAKYRNFCTVIADTLKTAQGYMKARDDECSFVSLRDVERAMIVFKYFFEKMNIFAPYMNEWAYGNRRHIDNEEEDIEKDEYTPPNHITRALILSVSVCYRARLQERMEFDKQVARCFTNPIALSYGVNQLQDEIRWCEEALLDNMELGPNIAKNSALRENVFMMAICVELRIPLFLVGKPGSSKSLAKAIISDSMRGKESRNELLRNFKEVGIFSYQCSQLSTPDSVIEVFKTAERFQAKQDKNSYVAVVVLDEVGLAEDSPNLPLKALHPLLEDGTEGRRIEEGDFSDLIVDQSQRVAFIGISNWALDPAKMNRGVMVTRADPSEYELVFSARGICSNIQNDPVRNELEPYFGQLATAYLKICELQKREFFGLRDFYSLIKMLYGMCKNADCSLTWQQMEHAIKRNFGGLEAEDWNTFDEFSKCLTMDQDVPHDNFSHLICPDSSRLGLIRSSLANSQKTWHGENRYVLFLTENYAALDILKNPEYLSSGNTLSYDIRADQPFILFGSSFPKDKEYTQVCRNINQIKICMETGRTVILLNLENLYESLYDVLNQYYIYHAGIRYVDLGLQTHRVRCRVANDFKLILIAEKDTVYSKFPTPLINRLEKHFVLTSSVLEDWQEAVLNTFVKWIADFCRAGTFNKNDAFIGFQKDTPASVIFHSTNLLRKACAAASISVQTSTFLHQSWLNLLQYSRLGKDHYNAEKEDPHLWNEAVLHLSKFLLLQTASPDSVFRVKNTPLHEEEGDIYNIYFHQQHHGSIQDFIYYLFDEMDSSRNLLVQVTTHSHLLSTSDVNEISAALDIKGFAFSLHSFDTELDFSNRIGPLFKKSSKHSENHLIVIQCDSGHLNGDLIASARYRIYDIRAKADEGQTTHVLFIIHLPRQISCALVGFQGEPWISAHIDDLRSTGEDVVELRDIVGGACISDLFIGGVKDNAINGKNVTSYGSQNSSDVNNDQELYEVDVSMEDMSSAELVESASNDEYWALKTDHTVNTGNSSIEPMEIAVDDIEEVSLDKHDTTGPEGQNLPSEFDKLELQEGSFKDTLQSQIATVQHIKTTASNSQNQFVTTENENSVYPFTQVHFKNPLFKRLYRCIQPAASRLDDLTMKRSTKRVELLVHLIPKEMPINFDESQFYGILIKHIYTLIQQREELYESEKNWIVVESMSSRNLLLGGTLTNALCRKADQVVIQILAEIVAVVDRNCNLDLIDPRNENVPVPQFWLKIFSNFQIMQFNFSNFVNKEDPLPGTGARKFGLDYECKFPFSWLVFEVFHGLFNNIKSAAGSNTIEVRNQLCDLVKQTSIGEILVSVDQYHVDEFYLKYLHDFIRIVHSFVQNNDEHVTRHYELICESLDALLRSEKFCSIDGNMSLIYKLSSLHVVYQLHQSQVLWFGQLVTHNPGAIVMLRKEEVRDNQEMILHLCALEKTIDCLSLKMERNDETVNLIPWICDLRVSQNIITSILAIPSENVLQTKLRLRWQLLKVLQLFADHILLNHSTIPVFYLRRLLLILEDNADFSAADTLDDIQQHLIVLERDAKRKTNRYIEAKEMNTFLRNCCRYFMEVISTVCFEHNSAPKPALIKMLMQIIFTESETRDLAPPFKTIKIDSKPTIRSSLLQLLLEYNSKDTKTYLNEYFKNSCRVLAQENNNYLCLLCIQCFEDALHKSYSTKGFVRRATDIHQILETSYLVLCDFEENHKISISYLEAVAGARFGLHVIAKLLHFQYCGSRISGSVSEAVLELFNLARVICTDKKINVLDASFDEDVVGPSFYLVKLLVRDYGLASLKEVSEVFKWIIPKCLAPTKQEKVLDPFVIYNEMQYSSIRTIMKDAYIGKQLDQLHEKSHDFTVKEVSVLLMAFYEIITMDYCHPKLLTMDDDLRKAFDEFIASLKQLTAPLRQLARKFLTNDQGGNLGQMKMSPQLPLSCRTLSTIVVHSTAVILSSSEHPIFLPFVNMLMNPAALINAYLPTMSEDPLSEVRKARGGMFYTCPNGHEYFVGECGKPVLESVCNVCRAHIGGQHHQLRSDNRSARINDTTQTGHDLGDPNSRTGIVGSERYLSPPAICIMRAIMHSAFIWCSSHYDECMSDLARIVKPLVSPQFLPEFFWKHLECDIKQLSTTTGKNEDDATLLIHIVLKEILSKTPPMGDTITTINSLMARNARQEWERIFSTHYISPVLETIQQCLNNAIELIANDNEQGHDQLFYLVHEKVKVKSDNLEPHLWTYRQKISLEHLGLTLKEEKLKKMHPILHEFLLMEPKLRATQYLSDIVKLQQSLFDRFNYRLDRAVAVRLTIKDFLEQLDNENSKNEYQQWIESVQKAWELVGHDLKTHGRKPVKDDVWVPSITLDKSIEYLIPTTTHTGVCTTSLVDFLTYTHNNFIDKCHGLVAGAVIRDEMKWLKNEVPITHIHHCHLLDYEHQIISVVLSHCHYSLKMGEAHTVKYDYQSLEKHILDKFIYGKPRILSDIPQVVFRKDIHSSATFAAVRERVKPQTRLQSRFQKEILAELCTPATLQANLDVIDTILGFLSSGGVKPDKSLSSYIERVLKMPKKFFSKKAQEFCQLKHILSLWETLSVELARLTWLRRQEPFNTVFEKQYHQDLTEEQKASLDGCLRVFDLNRLLGGLYEFIETSIRYQEHLEWTLVDVLVEDLYSGLALPEEFKEQFPRDITISQAVAAWKHIVDYQEKLKQL